MYRPLFHSERLSMFLLLSTGYVSCPPLAVVGNGSAILFGGSIVSCPTRGCFIAPQLLFPGAGLGSCIMLGGEECYAQATQPPTPVDGFVMVWLAGALLGAR